VKPTDIRTNAARRAAEGDLGNLDAAIGSAAGGDRELRELAACWVQEALLRGADVASRPSVRALWAKLQEEEHPLACLPLTLTDVERSVHDALPVFGSAAGSAWSCPAHPSTRIPAVAATGLVVREIAISAERSSELRAAVAGWSEHSNGAIEAHEFTLAPPASRLDAAVLFALGLSCLAGEPSVAIQSIDPSVAVEALLRAATNGGAYGGALCGAYGRLAAWRSLSALAGVPSRASVDRAAAAARECEWLSFFSEGWFEDVAWDLGLVALRPDRTTIAVLAATDTD
jgi:uncharacterized protein DUF6183